MAKKACGTFAVAVLSKDTRDTLQKISLLILESLNTIHSNRNLETRDQVEEQSIMLLTALHLLATLYASTG